MNKLLIACIALLALGAGAYAYLGGAATSNAALPGTVTYRERIALPAGSVVEVRIQDVSLADAPATVLGETRITTAGENVPIPFVVEYDPADIQPDRTYSVSARITLPDGQLRWITDTHVPFLQDGTPIPTVELLLVGVSRPPAGAGTSAPSGPAAPAAPPAAATSLEGKSFRLISYNNATISSQHGYTLSFENGRLNARFCNSMSGGYALREGILTAPQLASTLMYCATPPLVMDIEQKFGTLLSTGAGALFEGGRLTLAGEGAVLIFEEVRN